MYDHLETLAARELVRHRQPGYTATKDTNPCHCEHPVPRVQRAALGGGPVAEHKLTKSYALGQERGWRPRGVTQAGARLAEAMFSS
jgi:hypothetical protein